MISHDMPGEVSAQAPWHLYELIFMLLLVLFHVKKILTF